MVTDCLWMEMAKDWEYGCAGLRSSQSDWKIRVLGKYHPGLASPQEQAEARMERNSPVSYQTLLSPPRELRRQLPRRPGT